LPMIVVDEGETEDDTDCRYEYIKGAGLQVVGGRRKSTSQIIIAHTRSSPRRAADTADTVAAGGTAAVAAGTPAADTVAACTASRPWDHMTAVRTSILVLASAAYRHTAVAACPDTQLAASTSRSTRSQPQR